MKMEKSYIIAQSVMLQKRIQFQLMEFHMNVTSPVTGTKTTVITGKSVLVVKLVKKLLIHGMKER